MIPSRLEAPTPLADWMSALDDARPLPTLTLPGSHDSCAYTVDDPLVRTQRAPLDAQLAHGVRLLDIRCRHRCDTFDIHHGGIALGMSFDDVLADCTRFLDAHPRECIVMSVKDEWPAHASTRGFEATFDAHCARHPRLRWHAGGALPTLGDVRGAVVLLRRFRSRRPLGIDLTAWPDNATFTIDHPGAAFVIQDEYRVPVAGSIHYKWRVIDALLTGMPSPESGRWAVNFCSGTGMGANPSVVARGDGRVQGIQARLAERLRELHGPCGAVLLDFCDDDDWALVRALVECNDHVRESDGSRRLIGC
ncbi:Phosphatidylinositol diacylglycerol-lyase [Burkholderia ambifaria MC40-6]|uniref:1-phosphatidylinositol phosphodiesterase n=1 Tax=Burkholderia ambifaria (strain MC40-6) TaxID=398577 RepID=B1YXZ8_BURA4|nr:phosphatidylinositol-specific phospholipase C [Burkholderia ambifaria]ACB67132.1 Phosphatidylinositol diacylglycerol-lyase [Burkholderia ambifaria MC40-6]